MGQVVEEVGQDEAYRQTDRDGPAPEEVVDAITELQRCHRGHECHEDEHHRQQDQLIDETREESDGERCRRIAKGRRVDLGLGDDEADGLDDQQQDYADTEDHRGELVASDGDEDEDSDHNRQDDVGDDLAGLVHAHPRS